MEVGPRSQLGTAAESKGENKKSKSQECVVRADAVIMLRRRGGTLELEAVVGQLNL